MERRLLGPLIAALTLLVFSPMAAPGAWAACNLIPQTENTFDSVRGAATRPFAAPGEPIEVRLRPCESVPTPVISSSASDHLVTVVYTPTGGGAAHAVVLTAAADCTAVTPLLAACEAQLGVGGDAECVAGVTAGMQVVPRNATNYLRFSFPDSAAVFGSALAGPATIAVTSSTPGSLPCQLATNSCATQSGLVVCVDDLFAGDGACGRSSLQGTFNHFTALPAPNDFQASCWDPSPLCTLTQSQFRMATDEDGNILVPMDWRGILVKQNQVPVPRLLTAILSSPLPLLGIRIPGRSFVASYTPEGGLLPPIFEPESGTAVPPGVAALFGSADAPYTVLRLARRSDTFQQCTAGSNAGLPCNEIADCPSGTCGPTVCFGGARNLLPCSSDGACPNGECGPQLVDLRGAGTSGNGPVVLNRLDPGICQEDEPIAACSMSSQCAMGSGTCVGYALTAENPVPLEGLALSPLVFAFAMNEAIDNVPRNNDGDTIDTVVTLRDRSTGAKQPLGAPPPACGIPSSPVPEGRSVIRTQQAPFSFPALATDGKDVAFLESEATTNDPTPPNPACDMNGDGDTADAILRVFKLGNGEIIPSVSNPVASGDLAINGRALAVGNNRVFFRTAEQEDGAQHTTRVSLGPTGMQLNAQTGNAFSANIPIVSHDGRYVVFDAFDDAVTNDPPTGLAHHLVVRDVKLGNNTLLNINASAQLSQSCFDQTISADGRWAAFTCSTTNLLPLTYPSCTNVLYGTTPCEQVFLRDNCVSNGVPVVPCTPGLELVTADSLGNPGTDHTESPSISADGRYLAFVTWAPNLIGTTTTCSSKLYNSGTCPEIVVHDRCLSNGQPVGGGCVPSTTVVSVATDGTRTNARSETPIISANGRVVAFTSRATNLDPRDNGALESVFVHDLDTGVTSMVSLSSFGVSSNNYAWVPSLSADGRFVSFASLGGNLVPGDTNSWDTFVHDRLTGTTERISVNSNGVEQDGAQGGSDGGQLSADGRFVVFQTGDGNLVPGVPSGTWRVYVRDRATGTTKLVDRNDAGVPGDLRQSGIAAYITGDGRYAVFASFATNLVSGDTNTSCDYANDMTPPYENCSDVFYRGLDPNSASGDLSGDGEADDTALRVMNTGTGLVTTLCPATQVSVTGGAAAFLRPESAGATSNPGCTGGSLTGPNLNGPSDVDANDDVVHYVSNVNVVENLQVAASAVSLSGLCVGGTKNGQPCLDNTSCPESSTTQGICTPTYVSALVSEQDQNGTNLNGDNDVTPNDDVLEVYDLTAAAPGWVNVGHAADAVDASGTLVAFVTPEAAQNADLNSDGDKNDRVLQVYDARTKSRTNTGLAAADFVIGSEIDVCTTTPMVAFRSPESARCTVPLDQTTCHTLPGCSASQCDLNGDGDCCDSVLFTYAKGTGVLSTGQAVTPCRLEACDPRLPYRIFGATVKFLTYEIEQNQILNGDGDATDLVLQQYDACKKERRVISAVDPPGLCSVSATPCDSSDKCPIGETCLAQGGSSGQKDPTQEDPRDDGNIVVTSAKRCYQNTTLLLVPATCQVLADCPANATACVEELIVAAPGAAPHHDTVLAPVKPVSMTISAGQTEAMKTVRVKVRNADVLPAKEKASHVVRLSVEPGTCPALTLDGIDFDRKTAGDQDSYALTGNKVGVAKVRLRVRRDDFTTHNAKAPSRCSLILRATTVLLDNEDPTPRNNVQELELNVDDRNDVSVAVHESAVRSVSPIKLTIGESGVAAAKSVAVKLINGDLADPAGHDVALSVDQGDCPPGTVSLVPPSLISVAGGSSSVAGVSVSATAAAFRTASKVSLARCTALLTATTSVMGNVEPDTSNNVTRMLIEVKDKTDY